MKTILGYLKNRSAVATYAVLTVALLGIAFLLISYTAKASYPAKESSTVPYMLFDTITITDSNAGDCYADDFFGNEFSGGANWNKGSNSISAWGEAPSTCFGVSHGEAWAYVGKEIEVVHNPNKPVSRAKTLISMQGHLEAGTKGIGPGFGEADVYLELIDLTTWDRTRASIFTARSTNDSERGEDRDFYSSLVWNLEATHNYRVQLAGDIECGAYCEGHGYARFAAWYVRIDLDSCDCFDLRANPVSEGESIGRDKDSTDTDQPEDWDDHGGRDACGPTYGARNYQRIAPVIDGAVTNECEWDVSSSRVGWRVNSRGDGTIYSQRQIDWIAQSSSNNSATIPGYTTFLLHDIWGYQSSELADYNHFCINWDGHDREIWIFWGEDNTDSSVEAAWLLQSGLSTNYTTFDDRGFLVRYDNNPSTDRHWLPGSPEPGDPGWNPDGIHGTSDDYWGVFAVAGFNNSAYEMGLPNTSPVNHEVYELALIGAETIMDGACGVCEGGAGRGGGISDPKGGDPTDPLDPKGPSPSPGGGNAVVLPVPTPICSPTSGTITAVIQPQGGTLQSRDGAVTVAFPAGAVSDPTMALYMSQARTVVPGFSSVHFFTLEAYRKDDWRKVTQFDKPVTIRASYAGTDMAGLDESKLGLYYFDTTAHQWVSLPSMVDMGNKTVTASSVNHFSLYGLMAPASSAPPSTNPVPVFFGMALLVVIAGMAVGVRRWRQS